MNISHYENNSISTTSVTVVLQLELGVVKKPVYLTIITRRCTKNGLSYPSSSFVVVKIHELSTAFHTPTNIYREKSRLYNSKSGLVFNVEIFNVDTRFGHGC